MAFFNFSESVPASDLDEQVVNVAVIEDISFSHSPYRKHSDKPDGYEIEAWNGVYGSSREAMEFAEKVSAVGILIRACDGSGKYAIQYNVYHYVSSNV